MKVKELIQHLEIMNQDAEVVYDVEDDLRSYEVEVFDVSYRQEPFSDKVDTTKVRLR